MPTYIHNAKSPVKAKGNNSAKPYFLLPRPDKEEWKFMAKRIKKLKEERVGKRRSEERRVGKEC